MAPEPPTAVASERRSRWAAFGAALAALAASLCCVGPVVAAVVGIGALGALVRVVEPLRPYLTVAMVALFGLAFFWAYRPTPARCDADGRCVLPTGRRRARRWLWIVALIALVMWSFPYWFPAIAG